MNFTKEYTSMFALAYLANDCELSTQQKEVLESLHNKIMKSELVQDEYDTEKATDEVFASCVVVLEDYLTKEGL